MPYNESLRTVLGESGDIQVSRRIAQRYRLEHELGRGGMAVVYQALDEHTGERVAVKCLRTDKSSAHELTALFKREFYTLKQLAHPRIVRVYEFGVDADDTPFYTMEVLSGGDLTQLAPAPWRQACSMLRDVASSLAIVHSRKLVHRDVSARNVYRASGGGAKLLDFGAMTSMGVASEVIVGTAPYVAPEVLHRQALDERTDLYSLGATAYFALTGRHAYPARALRDLRDRWRTPPRPPSQYAAEIPESLDALILSLLSLDRRTRPVSAAEVIDRLNAIAGLEVAPEHETAQAYLSQPKLVQREEQLLLGRKRLLRASRGRGGALWVEGEPGCGRSRLLQEYLLEAKLSGALAVWRAASPQDQAFAVARSLASQLAAASPQAACAAAQSHPILWDLVPALAPEDAEGGAPVIEGRADLRAARLDALAAWVNTLSARRPLTLVVDDVEHCDEPSAAWLAALASGAADRKLAILCSGRRGAESRAPDALALLERHAVTATARALDLQGTRELFGHVFGVTRHLGELADWAQRITHGNPQQCMELARDLVQRDVVRYVDGAWLLPHSLRDQALPSSLADAFAARIGALPRDARELAQVLCVYGAPASPALCVALSLTEDDARTFAALDALVAAEILDSTDQVYRFRQGAVREAVERTLSPRRRQWLHRHIGKALAPGACGAHELLRAGWHLLRGGDEEHGVSLVSQASEHMADLGNDYDRSVVEPLELALAASERIGRPVAERLRLRTTLVACAFFFDQRLIEYADGAVESLRHYAGLARLDEYDSSLPLAERVKRALKVAQDAYEACPAHQRGPAPLEACGQLAKVLLMIQSVCATAYDIEGVVRLCPQLEPLATLHPSAAIFYDNCVAAVHGLQGRGAQALAIQEQIVERARELQQQGIDVHRMRSMQSSLSYIVGMRYAIVDTSTALSYADRIQALGSKLHQAGAEQLRMLAHLFDGRIHHAREYDQRMEQCLVQYRSHASRGLHMPLLIYAYSLSADLIGLKRTLDEVRRLSEQRPGYVPYVHVAEGAYHLTRGDAARALEASSEVLAMTQPGKHSAWVYGVDLQAKALLSLREFQQAKRVAEDALETAVAEGLSPLPNALVPTLALIDAELGAFDRATERLDAEIACSVREGRPRLQLGFLYQARARVALLARHREDFETYAQHLADTYAGTDNPALIAAYDRLMEAARQYDVDVSSDLAQAGKDHITSRVETDLAGRVDTLFAACEDAEARAARSLELLLESIGEHCGVLCLLRREGCGLACARGMEPSDELLSQLSAYLEAELRDGVEVTQTMFDAEQTDDDHSMMTGSERYWPVVLRGLVGGEPVIAGIAAVPMRAQEVPSVDWNLVAAVAVQLVRADDVVAAPVLD